MLRPIIQIDEEKCNGCGQCITDCAEGALAIVNGKARLISESYCDGLGACLNCPQGALTLAMSEAPPFDEEGALKAKAVRDAACANPMPKELRPIGAKASGLQAHLPTWPIQLALVPANAAYLKNSDLLLAAHCAGFALPDIQKNWISGRVPVIACPKLENQAMLAERLAGIIAKNDLGSITILKMSVPCCSGLERLTLQALETAGVKVPVTAHTVQL